MARKQEPQDPNLPKGKKVIVQDGLPVLVDIHFKPSKQVPKPVDTQDDATPVQ